MTDAPATRHPSSEPLGRRYLALLTASGISNLGDGIGTVAWPWVASLLTRDPVSIALVGIALRLPWLLFSLPAGVIIDRFDRRRLVLAMDVLRFGLLNGLGLAVWAAMPLALDDTAGFPASPIYWLLIATAFVYGCAEVLRDNCAQTLMPAIVPASRLQAANGRLWSVELVGNSLLGPPLAGLIIAVALPLAFIANGFGFAFAALCIYSIKGPFRANGQGERRHWIAEVREGASFLWRNTLLRDLALALAALNAMTFLMLVALVLFAQDVLGMSSAEYGLLLTAAAAGGIIGGLMADALVRRLGPGNALRLTLLAITVQLAVIALSSHAAPVWCALVLAEFFGMVWNTITVSMRQSLVPQHILGRVNSVYRFFAWGSIPLGLLLSGLIVRLAEGLTNHETALATPFAFGAVVMALTTALFWKRFSNARLSAAHFA
ncbi:MFS transporter [Rhizobium sp. CSW-27]|uniref:MFS transporter n=1 Tax=Rhizobium sp. CSW-27 TaxID=2839985 RepID=UPI001C036849|nr:MFS transporter [Rhizobium sp. CSW-27]MBT9369466.1 MFS transporter [Rhizobium sp. CSW-27]